MQIAAAVPSVTDAASTPPPLVRRGDGDSSLTFPSANLGPLTSTFTPPTSCASLTFAYTGNIRGQTPVLGFDYGKNCDSNRFRVADPACLPPRYGAAYNNLLAAADENNKIYPVYSPATICPAGYTSACGFSGPTSTSPGSGTALPTATDTKSTAFQWTMSRLLGSQESAIGCCPRGFACHSTVAYHCISEPNPGDVVTADANSFCTSHTTTIKYWTVSPSASVYADAACVLLVRGVTSTTSLSSTSSSSTTTPSPTSVPVADGNNNNNSSGLSTGAKAAIGVCVPLFAIFVGLAIFLLLRRRSQRAAAAAATSKDDAAATPAPPGYGLGDKVEMDGTDRRQSSLMYDPSDRVVSQVSDMSSSAVGSGASVARTSELYGSSPLPPLQRLHEDIIELPVESDSPAVRV